MGCFSICFEMEIFKLFSLLNNLQSQLENTAQITRDVKGIFLITCILIWMFNLKCDFQVILAIIQF